MDFSVVILRFLFLVIVILPNYFFFIKVRKIEKKRLKHALIFFLTSLILSFLIILFLAILKELISDFLNIKIKHNISYMILFASLTLPLSVLLNLYLAKFYLKRISNTQNKNQIELIGKE